MFMGDGPQKPRLEAEDGCVIHPFVAHSDLPPFYRAADLAVWPIEITISTLDAAACGLPVVMSDAYESRAPERVNGNGMTYRENDLEDMLRVLRALQDKSRRDRLGQAGAQKMLREFSWLHLARGRINDYERSRALRHARKCKGPLARCNHL